MIIQQLTEHNNMSQFRKLIDSIISNKLNEASENISECFVNILQEKLVEAKKIVAAKYELSEHAENLEEIDRIDESNNNRTRMGRISLIRVRIRNGKIQRRKKVSAVKGLVLRGGRLIRMTPTERRKRIMGQRRAKIKRRAKLARALLKRKRSLMRRKALGV